LVEGLGADLRYAARALRGSPGFTAAAVISLGLGIGANTALFSLLDGLIFRSPALESPERLVSVIATSGKAAQRSPLVSYSVFRALRERASSLGDVEASQQIVLGLGRGAHGERAVGMLVSDGYLGLLGVRATRGEVSLSVADHGTEAIAVVSHRVWRDRLGSPGDLSTATLRLNGHPFRIVGVLAPGFQGPDPGVPVEVWVPVAARSMVLSGQFGDIESADALFFNITARLRSGTPFDTARAEVEALGRPLHRELVPSSPDRGLTLVSLRENTSFFTDDKTVAGLLLGITAIVLLIACSNVAGLLLHRTAARRREVAIRISVGASRGRLVRLFLAESLILATLGGTLALLIAGLCRGLPSAFPAPVSVPLALEITLDARTLVFTLALSLASAVLSGLGPALRASRPDILQSIRSESSGTPRALLVRDVLVASQVALAVVSLAGAALFVRSLRYWQRIDLGFEPRNVAVVSLDVSLRGYDDRRGRQLYNDLLRRAEGLPGVESAALADHIPLWWEPGLRGGRAYADGHPPDRREDAAFVLQSVVSARYFETLGIPILQGRGLGDADGTGAPPVAVVNEALARRLWPDGPAVGQRLGFLGMPFGHGVFGSQDASFEVVGVARQSSQMSLGDSAPLVFVSAAQHYAPALTLHVRSRGAAGNLVPLLEHVVADLDPDLPILTAMPLAEVTERALWAERAAAAALQGFAVLALLLASVGLQGTTAHAVGLRTREIGIRMALGARRRSVLGTVLGRALVSIAAGVVVGLALALGLGRAVSSLLYGISPQDPVSMGLAVAALVLVGLVASGLPARRATRIDPVAALRHD
jgi:predicted permease